MQPLVVDIHSHVIPERIPDWAHRFGYGGFISLERYGPGCARMMRDGKIFREVRANLWDSATRLNERDAQGVHVDVLSVIPVMFAYHANPEHGYDVSRFLNDHIAGLVATSPQRFVGLGTLPMQSAEFAVKELERCRQQLGLCGVEIGTRVNGLDLDAPQFRPVLEAAQALDMAIFVHPWEMAQGERLSDNWGEWMLGMPQETAIAMTKLGFNARVVENFPKLRLGFAHGGGVAPWLRGRMEHGFKVRPDLFSSVAPGSFLNSYFYDSHLCDPAALRLLVEQVGTSQVMLGSDYPFPLGDPEPGKIVRTLKLPPAEEAKLLAGNALRFLGLDAGRFTPP